MALGYPHPDKMFEELNSKQIADLMAYYSLEPFGHPSEYYMIGEVSAMLYNINKKKGAKTLDGWDFVPFPKMPTGKKQTAMEIKGLLMAAAGSKDGVKKEKIVHRGGKTKRQLKRERQLKEKGG